MTRGGGASSGAANLAGLTALTSLDLRGNGTIDSTPLLQLKCLKRLDASGCTFDWDILALCHVLAANDAELILYGASVPNLPPEVLSQHFNDNCLERLLAHYDDLREGAAEITDVKFMILGNGRVGKTQICRRLRRRDDEPYDEAVKSTHSIQVLPAEIAAGPGLAPITLRMWDFGGQDIYHGPHALFLKSRAIFPVVWTPASEGAKLHVHDARASSRAAGCGRCGGSGQRKSRSCSSPSCSGAASASSGAAPRRGWRPSTSRLTCCPTGGIRRLPTSWRNGGTRSPRRRPRRSPTSCCRPA